MSNGFLPDFLPDKTQRFTNFIQPGLIVVKKLLRSDHEEPGTLSQFSARRGAKPRIPLIRYSLSLIIDLSHRMAVKTIAFILQAI